MVAQRQTENIPHWWYWNSRPASDEAYFENLCRILFQTGLNWAVVEKKWLTIKRALCDFNVEEIANFTDTDVRRLLANRGMIRNKYKIHAIIWNAKKFQQITRQYGSFRAYLDGFDKSDNYAKVVEALADRFERIGPTTAALFLLSVGEKIKPKGRY